MRDMIERMARAIQRSDLPNERNEYVIETDWELNRNLYERHAKAALTALQEPTPEIVEAGGKVIGFGGDPESAERVFIAMIKAIQEGE